MKTAWLLGAVVTLWLAVPGPLLAVQSVTAVQGRDSDYYDYEDYSQTPDGKLVPLGEVEMLKGCSWYCGGYVERISASSQLEAAGGRSYQAANAHDFNRDTAWVEGVEGDGVGESLVYEFNFDREPHYSGRLGVTKILFANGYKKSRALWEANSRVKSLRMYVDGQPYRDIQLLDAFEVQTIDIGTVMFPPGKTTVLRFEITGVYPGSKYRDTAITELVFEGVGVH